MKLEFSSSSPSPEIPEPAQDRWREPAGDFGNETPAPAAAQTPAPEALKQVDPASDLNEPAYNRRRRNLFE